MSRIYSHVNTAKTILSNYNGEMPFAAFIKNFFSKEKKYGSKDRKTISTLCYNYFRLGAAAKRFSIEEGLTISQFLRNDASNEWLQTERPEWTDKIALPLKDKLAIADLDVNSIFPFNDELSERIKTEDFDTSFLIQPNVYVRVRPGKPTLVKNKLLEAKIEFEQIDEHCYSFQNGVKLSEVLDINKEVVIQDLNSQRVGELLFLPNVGKHASVWDCCAASGGKSIMAVDMLPAINLTVSDVRNSIIQNLHNRFKEAGIKNYRPFVADVTNKNSLTQTLNASTFDLIICDAPCSGSGTWSRTPEQLLFFEKEQITRYSDLQKSIATNVIPFLKKGGYFLYITCSVFAKENEQVVEFIKAEHHLSLVKAQLFEGYNVKADSMFAALFQNT
jgi:16S rRNA (cytosine967-C5)-methyltransferase